MKIKLPKIKRQITPQNIKQVESRIILFTLIILFIAGYVVLFNVNTVLADYVLSANILLIANYILYKLK